MQIRLNGASGIPSKERVVFLCYHGFGHHNPCFPLASTLREQGHKVTLASAAFFNGYVTRAGYAHYPLRSVPFGLGFEWWVNSEAKERHPYIACLRDRFTDRLYRARERELFKMLDDLRPDVILLDGTQATDFIVLFQQASKRHIALAVVHAMFPTFVLRGRPPVNSHLVPGEVGDEKKALTKMRRRLDRTDLKQRLAYFGMSDRYLIRRRLRKNKIPDPYIDRTPSLFDFQVSNLTTFILAPREFDFPDFDVPRHHHYVGFMQLRSSPSTDEKWLQTKRLIHDQKATGVKIVYCSFGTVSDTDETRTDAYMMRLADAVSQQGNTLIISMGGRHAIPRDLNRSNVMVFHTVPQTELLEYCDTFITHGGLSSIKEGIEATVPMLVVTVHHQFDPPGNAARVQFHGLGIRGSIDDDSRVLREQLSLLLGDPAFRDRLTKFREKNARYATEAFLSVFQSL